MTSPDKRVVLKDDLTDAAQRPVDKAECRMVLEVILVHDTFSCDAVEIPPFRMECRRLSAAAPSEQEIALRHRQDIAGSQVMILPSTRT